MKQVFSLLALLLIGYSQSSAQNKKNPFSGRWINTQYEFYKNQPGYNEIALFRVSPQFIHIDSSGRCTIQWQFEHRTEYGLPDVKSQNYSSQYHCGKDITLYTVERNDTLIVYSRSTPGAGIIFRKMKD